MCAALRHPYNLRSSKSSPQGRQCIIVTVRASTTEANRRQPAACSYTAADIDGMDTVPNIAIGAGMVCAIATRRTLL